MAMLYPPYLEGTIPAQIGNTLRIPYQLNRAQGLADLMSADVHIRIKTINSNKILFELNQLFTYTSQQILYIQIPQEELQKLIVGQYYKIQLGFKNPEEQMAIYFSTPAVFKYTEEPKLSIRNLKINCINQGRLYFEGEFTSSSDAAEKLKEYKFNVYVNDQLYDSTDWQFVTFNTKIEYSMQKYLNDDTIYYIECVGKTTNNLTIKSNKYQVQKGNTSFSGNIVGQYDLETGIVQLITTSPINGKVCIVRGEGQNPGEYVVMTTLEVYFNNTANHILFNDFTVEQGKTYTYGLYQIINGTCSATVYSKPIYVDFEDIYLYDGERQLKVRFDPKVSSLKTTVLEQKTDTIGGQFPIFSRNGVVGYKEIPISGLISMHMDKEGLFAGEWVQSIFNGENEVRCETSSESDFEPMSLAQEVYYERKFREEVLQWLNNGKPKLFRSATEGNAIVRLMNISLSPNDTLGRRLYTFSSTAYEIAAYNLSTLLQYNFIPNSSNYLPPSQKVEVVRTAVDSNQTLTLNADVTASITGPIGTSLVLSFLNGTLSNVNIGKTGTYNVFIAADNPLTTIRSSQTVSVEYSTSKTSNNVQTPIYTITNQFGLTSLEAGAILSNMRFLDLQLMIKNTNSEDGNNNVTLQHKQDATLNYVVDLTKIGSIHYTQDELAQYTGLILGDNVNAIAYGIQLNEGGV